jgi:Tol biopolymer transport system component
VSPCSFSPDGKRLAYYYATMELSDLWTLQLDLADPEHPKAGKPEPFLQTPASEIFPIFSPDGRWMAYMAMESGTFDIFVRPFPPSPEGGKWKVSNRGGRFPVWSRAGSQLLYTAQDGDLCLS